MLSGHVIPTPVKWSVTGIRQETNQRFSYRFHDGIRISSTFPSDPLKYDCENHKYVWDNMGIEQQKVEKEKAKQRSVGPLTSVLLQNIFYSPLRLVPKKEPCEFRLIHDLSFPRTNSV